MIIITIVIFIIFLSLPFLRINNNINYIILRRIGAISLVYASVLNFNTLYIQSIGSGLGIFSGLFNINLISNLISIFILLISSIILLIWPILISGSINNKNNNSNTLKTKAENIIFDDNTTISNEYVLIVLFNILGALFLITSYDLVSMYLSIELQSFALYILASLYKNKLTATSAGLKYFLLGGLSSCIILLGSGLIYTYTGLTNIESIFNLILSICSDNTDIFNFSLNLSLPNSMQELKFIETIFNHSLYYNDIKGIILGFIFIFVGFLFKIAASPFHNWSPDVYDDTPNIVTIWLTILPKLSILIFLLIVFTQIQTISSITNIAEILNINNINMFNNINNFNNVITNLLLSSSLLSLIIGAILGLKQIRIKRLLAYSTINHIGFILLALAVSSNYSIESFIFYIIQYTITNLNIFLIILALGYLINIKIENNLNSNKKKLEALTGEEELNYKIKLSDIEYINSLKGLFFVNPILSISLAISLFSFAGIPPLIGFFAKQQVLYASNSAGYLFLSLIAIIVSVISASYYLKIIKVLLSNNKKININNIEINNLKNNNIIINKIINSYSYKNILSNVHCFLIGTLTLSIVFFVLNPEIILNTITIFINLFFNL